MPIASLQIAERLIESETCVVEFSNQGRFLCLEKLRMCCNSLKPPTLDPAIEIGRSTEPVCISIVREAQTVDLGVEERAGEAWAPE